MRFKVVAETAGFGLIEVLISVGLLSLVAAGSAQYFANTQKTLKQNRTYTYRDILVNQVARFAADGKALNQSSAFMGGGGFPDNSSFAICANGGGGASGCKAGSGQKMVLTDSFGNVIAGTSTAPRLYDLTGAPCNGPASPVCPIQVFTSFAADCGPGNATCPRARAVTVSFNIQPDPSVNLGPSVNLKPYTTSFINQIPLYITRSPGTLNHIPVWKTNTTLGDSNIIQSGTNLGVNTTASQVPITLTDTGAAAANLLIESSSAGAGVPRLALVDTATSPVTSAPAWYLQSFTIPSWQPQNHLQITRQSDLNTATAPLFDLGFVDPYGTYNPGVGVLSLGGSSGENVVNLNSNDPPNDSANDLVNMTFSDQYSPEYVIQYAHGSVASPQPIQAWEGDAGRFNAFGYTGKGSWPWVMMGGISWVPTSSFDGVSDSSLLYLKITDSANNKDGGSYTAMTIVSNGNVGINTYPGNNRLEIWGNIRVQGTTTDCIVGNGSGGTNCTSDSRLKEHVVPLTGALQKLQLIRGVEFDWNEKSANSAGLHDSGVIAQEVQKVFPETVMQSKDTGYLMVNYGALVSPLIQATHELDGLCRVSGEESSRSDGEFAKLLSRAQLQEQKLAAFTDSQKRLIERGSALKARLAALEKVLGLVAK